MDYEKLHKDTIAKLQEMVNSGKITVEIARGICADFIQESEDERIRKALIEAIRHNYVLTGSINHIPTKDILAWLEKHSEQKTVDEIAKEVCKNKESAMAFLKSAGIINEKGELAEQYRQSEQKSIDELTQQEAMDIAVAKCFVQGEQNPADKTEPKFKIGDWVICKNGSPRVFQVIERSWPNAKYLDEKGAGGFLNVATLDKQYRPWTIKDAKAGDLLADDYGIYIFDRFDEYDEKCFHCMGAYQHSQKVYENEHMLCSVEVHPATKEQRDILFQKMHESGYEWDADKKESKKIEQRPQFTWKPSESDVRILEQVIDGTANPINYHATLHAILEKLKKLREK